MVLAKVMTARADLPSTIAAVLAFTQAAAAFVGVLAVARTPEGLLNVPAVELVLVCIMTIAVAVVLALGSLHLLTGRPPRFAIAGSVASLVLSAYWIFLRPPAESFPDIAVAYAVLPVLILGLLGISRLRTSRRAKRPTTVAPVEAADGPAYQEVERPWKSDHRESEGIVRRDMLVE